LCVGGLLGCWFIAVKLIKNLSTNSHVDKSPSVEDSLIFKQVRTCLKLNKYPVPGC